MTILGKILVIFNLLFSLVVAALLIMVYITRTNWADGFNKLKDRYDVANANARAYQTERDEAIAKADKATKDLQAEVGKLNDRLTTAKNETQALQDQLNKEQGKGTKSEAAGVSTLQALSEMQKEVDQAKKTNKDLYDYIHHPQTGLLVKMDELRTQYVTAKIERDGLKTQNKELEGKLQEMAKQVVRLQAGTANVGVGVGGGSKQVKNPPLENVEGLIEAIDATDARSGLVKITIGSDSGIAKGHTLEVFRLNRIPEQSKYLGTIEIIRVEEKKAIGRPVQRMLSPVEVGDRVASKISG